VLSYTLDDRVRVLDLHNSSENEIVINIPDLLTQAVPDIADHGKGTFQTLYYSDQIISCLYKSSGPDSSAWLIAFSIRPRAILVAEELDSTDKIFVRHDKHFLYYGTHSELGTDGYKKWVLHGYEFRTCKWFDEKIHLPDMVGSEIGSTICFEFHDGYFYALSNQTSFEVEEIDWTSFYHCIRFPLNSPCKALLEKSENDRSMWRRQHQEGPIDDRWTNLRLDRDESTGELRIVESRKEWYLGSSRSQRTYYTTDIVFPKLVKDEDMEMGDLRESSPEESNFGLPSTSAWNSESTLNASLLASASSSSTNAPSTSTSSILSGLPAFPLLRLMKKDDHAHYIDAPPRLPQNTHPGNDGSMQPTFTLAKSRIRTYHPACSTFMDLVDDPLPTDWQGKQRLRLRAGSRKLGPPLLDSDGLSRPPDEDWRVAVQEMYIEQGVKFWPAAQRPVDEGADEELDQVYRLLNPPSHLGNVEGTSDERGLVYVTGGVDAPQAIIFVSFDPSTKLSGMKRWGQKGVGEGPHVDGRATGTSIGVTGIGDETSDRGWKGKEVFVDVGEADRTVSIDRKGKRKAIDAPAVSMQQVAGGIAVVDVRGRQSTATACGQVGDAQALRKWAWKETAMYRDIGLGFYFGL